MTIESDVRILVEESLFCRWRWCCWWCGLWIAVVVEEKCLFKCFPEGPFFSWVIRLQEVLLSQESSMTSVSSCISSPSTSSCCSWLWSSCWGWWCFFLCWNHRRKREKNSLLDSRQDRYSFLFLDLRRGFFPRRRLVFTWLSRRLWLWFLLWSFFFLFRLFTRDWQESGAKLLSVVVVVVVICFASETIARLPSSSPSFGSEDEEACASSSCWRNWWWSWLSRVSWCCPDVLDDVRRVKRTGIFFLLLLLPVMKKGCSFVVKTLTMIEENRQEKKKARKRKYSSPLLLSCSFFFFFFLSSSFLLLSFFSSQKIFRRLLILFFFFFLLPFLVTEKTTEKWQAVKSDEDDDSGLFEWRSQQVYFDDNTKSDREVTEGKSHLKDLMGEEMMKHIKVDVWCPQREQHTTVVDTINVWIEESETCFWSETRLLLLLSLRKKRGVRAVVFLLSVFRRSR